MIKVFSLLFILDQTTKKLVVWQNLPHQQNFNASFIIPISIVFLLLLSLWFAKNPKLSLLLILIGGLSNFLNRLTLGYVIDWIYLPFFPFSVFNLADIYITTGLLLTIYLCSCSSASMASS
ncbi:signal peptidase II [Patescibacteria group bacterium]|nr:signal peptidase II [Patescibacteria group bacterium]MBU1256480.1 signal peptidase II [Patescibacteria group bacterium]MBU1457554.1 signal peptidase II [Patescibacteria group bacterium]